MTISIKPIADLAYPKEVVGVSDLYRQFYGQLCNILLAGRFLEERILDRESVIFSVLDDDSIVGIRIKKLKNTVHASNAVRNKNKIN